MSLPHRTRLAIRTLLVTLLSLPALLQAETEQRWYQVEIIVFSQNSPDYHDSELWPLDYTLPKIEESRELLANKGADNAAMLPEPFSLVAADKLQLGETAERIKHASDVELVLHLGWLQPGLAEDRAVAVHIYEGMLEQQQVPVTPVETAPLETIETIEPPKLDGTLRVILSRYLHLESDLIWREPLPPSLFGFAEELPARASEAEVGDANGTAAVPDTAVDSGMLNYQVYRLQQSRKMRSNEIHYIDHPLFGIVAQITRYEPEPSDDAAKPD